jgi:hypothetical protein
MKKEPTTHKTPAKKQGGAGKGKAKDDKSGRAGDAGPMHQEGRTIHNGSAGAFDATEHSHDEEDEDQDSDDFAMDR